MLPQIRAYPRNSLTIQHNIASPHLACSCVTMPALEMEIVCCSMASWMLVLSESFILSNSSIRQTPLSASTRAPASRVHSWRKGIRI